MLGEIDDELMDVIGIDTIAVQSQKTIFGFNNENWKKFKTPWDQEVLVPENFNVTQEQNGDLLIYPEGDLSAPSSGKMPTGSYFLIQLSGRNQLMRLIWTLKIIWKNSN